MRAAVCVSAGGPEVLEIREVPVPAVRPGWSLVRVEGAGLNRSELRTRQGHSPSVRFPRVLGIECVGVVAASTDPAVPDGTTVAVSRPDHGPVIEPINVNVAVAATPGAGSPPPTPPSSSTPSPASKPRAVNSKLPHADALAWSPDASLLALAVSGRTPDPAAPELPTIAATLPGYSATSWFAILGPAGTPSGVIARLNTELDRIVHEAETKERFAAIGGEPIGGPPSTLASLIHEEIPRWRRVAKEAGIHIE